MLMALLLAATTGVNVVEIEACVANNECFYFPKQTPFVQDVSYASNMQYAEALDAMNRMYGLSACAEKAKRVRAKVREQS